jgi:hypothetical protein
MASIIFVYSGVVLGLASYVLGAGSFASARCGINGLL